MRLIRMPMTYGLLRPYNDCLIGPTAYHDCDVRHFPADIDSRIRPMLEGCFTDLYALLTNVRRALTDKGKIAFCIKCMGAVG